MRTKREGFNPRARKERDFLFLYFFVMFPCFNPRARKERDALVNGFALYFSGFNPRARKERDSQTAKKAVDKMPFQSTRP